MANLLSPALAAREKAALSLLGEALERHAPGIALACSFSAEDVVALDLLAQLQPAPRVFAIDTGRLPEETQLCAETLRQRYGLRIEWYFPRHEAVEALLAAAGPYSFRDGLTERHACCAIRKVEPLGRALQGLQAWITGLRREQNLTRTDLPEVEEDRVHGGLRKYNPLAEWSFAEVWAYVEARGLPRHGLYRQGYRSLGCAPCTRAVQPGEDDRAGRWWWEEPRHKECGLHVASPSPLPLNLR